jgi:hypothetical protein
MRYRFALALASLAVVVLATGAPGGVAQGQPPLYGDSSTLIIDVVPLQAEVRLNGVPIGTAHDLIAHSIPVIPGGHVVEVTAPGYMPTRVDVWAAVNWSTRVWLQLVPERQ